MIADGANDADVKAAVAIAPFAVSGQDAAALLGVSARTWRRLNAAGLVPQALRVGGSKRWSVAELRGWIEAGCPARARWVQLRG